jgi:hypothetical protein
LWSIYSIDREDMKGYLSLVVEAIKRGLEGNKVAGLDRERLRKAKRMAPGCAERMRDVKSAA